MFSPLDQIANGQAPGPRGPGPGSLNVLEMLMRSYTGLRNLPQEFYSPTPPVTPAPGMGPAEQRFLQGVPPGFFGAPIAQRSSSNALTQLAGPAPTASTSDVLNPPPVGLRTPATITNLYNRKPLKNPDGSTSTTSSKSFGFDNGEVLLPTVIDGKRLTDEQAIQHFLATGEHLGVFDTPENADAYAEHLHEMQAQKMGLSAPMPRLRPQASNALQSTRAPILTLAQLFAGNDNAKGSGAKGGVRTLPTLPPQQTPRVVDLPSVAGGYMGAGDALPEPLPDNRNRPAAPWFWPFR